MALGLHLIFPYSPGTLMLFQLKPKILALVYFRVKGTRVCVTNKIIRLLLVEAGSGAKEVQI